MRKLCIIILSFLLLCVGCQPTPAVDAVKQKNTNQLIEAVKEAEPAPVPVNGLQASVRQRKRIQV